MTTKRPRGRPPFKPTAAHRRSVEQLKAVGATEDTIRRALGINLETLKKYFADNLENGWSRRYQEMVELLFKAARAGNITAQRKVLEVIETNPDALSRDGIAQMMAKPVAEPVHLPLPREPKLGKKEQALKDAKSPDVTNTLGELMAQRRGAAVN